jgi:hypothetical protein
MPTDNFKLLAQDRAASLTAGHADNARFTVDSAHEAIVKSIHVVNTDTSARWFKVFHSQATTYDDTTAITPQLTIPAGGMAIFDGTITMDATDTLGFDVEVVDKITISVYGDEIDVS